MRRRNRRWLGVGLLAGGCAGLMGLTSMLNAAFAFGTDSGTALIMGFVMDPDPGKSYDQQVMDLFIDPKAPLFPGQAVFPGFNPVVESLNPTDYGPSLDAAAQSLVEEIQKHLPDGPVTVFGYSSTSSITTQAMLDMAQMGANAPDPADLHFVLFEDLNSPNGGIFTRFDPTSGITLPPTPADSPYPTDIYDVEYSGASDFPKYPLNLLAVANAMAGYVYLHPALIPGYPTSFDPGAVADAVKLPVSTGYDGSTDYFLIPTQDLPLLEPIRQFPILGPAMADLIQPDLRVLVDLGYDWSDPANEVSRVSWTLPSINMTDLMNELTLGAKQGQIAAMVDLGILPKSELPDAYPYLPLPPGQDAPPDLTADAPAPDAAAEVTGGLLAHPADLLSF